METELATVMLGTDALTGLTIQGTTYSENKVYRGIPPFLQDDLLKMLGKDIRRSLRWDFDIQKERLVAEVHADIPSGAGSTALEIKAVVDGRAKGKVGVASDFVVHRLAMGARIDRLGESEVVASTAHIRRLGLEKLCDLIDNQVEKLAW